MPSRFFFYGGRSALGRLSPVRAALCASLLIASLSASAINVVREVSPGAGAVLSDGRKFFLQLRVPKGPEAKPFLIQFLQNEADWKTYTAASTVAIPMNRIKVPVQRRMILAVFERDYVDDAGWHHTTLSIEAPYRESLWSLCEWLTGQGFNYEKVMAVNNITDQALSPGQQILIPMELVREEFREPTPDRIPAMEPLAVEEPEPKPAPKSRGRTKQKVETPAVKERPPLDDVAFEDEPVLSDLDDLEALENELTYTPAENPQYAEYRLKKGEALYTAVVVRFTDLDLGEGANEAIMASCDRIAKESKIKDVHHMGVGQRVLIPIDMLSDRFKPASDAARQEFEEGLVEAKKLKGVVKSKDLEGIAVVLDPGHGGRDQGAANPSQKVFEDEVNYDIVCRTKRILERETRARVYVTMLDPNQKYEPTNTKSFTHDTDEVVLTTPNYKNDDPKISVYLRWILANSIYRAEQAKGTDKMKMVFVSVHTDSLYNSKLRGAMVYIPGAKHRKSEEGVWPPGEYNKYTKNANERKAVSTAAERRRDEALSRNFAETLLKELGEQNVKRHAQGDPIRSQIVQSGGKVYVPGVLRGTLIPTKVLVETANLRNETDCERLRDPEWRENFARGLANAIRAHFGS